MVRIEVKCVIGESIIENCMEEGKIPANMQLIIGEMKNQYKTIFFFDRL